MPVNKKVDKYPDTDPPDDSDEYDSSFIDDTDFDSELETDIEDIIEDVVEDLFENVVEDLIKRKLTDPLLFDDYEDEPRSHNSLLNTEEGAEITKRLNSCKKQLEEYNNSINPFNLSNADRIMLMDVDIATKNSIIEKIDKKGNSDESNKIDSWVDSLLSIPFNVYKNIEVNSDSSPKEISDFLTNFKKKLDKEVHGMEEVKNEILSFVAKRIINPTSKGSILALKGPKGTAKCLDPETPVLMFSGETKKVKELQIGECLRGDDNTPRIIIGLANGYDKMYKISPKYGEPYIVNKNHILCLQDRISNNVTEISVEKFLKLPRLIQKTYVGYHKPVDYNNELWNGQESPYKLGYNHDKIVPTSVLGHSRRTRHDYLNGLLKRSVYDMPRNFKVPKSESMIQLIWSLGFKIVRKDQNYLYIDTKKSMKDPIKIQYMGPGEYSGFELTGNGRFLFPDHTVSHNTRIARRGIAEALSLPFHSINFGGMKDSSIITGHDMTYVGATYGKIAQILIKSGCMNPVIYMDEIDKIGESSNHTDIFGVLTHLLDEEQNHEFEDNYFKGIKLDLSKALFIISFNELSNIDDIAADRMRVIDVSPPKITDKIYIAKNIMIPEILFQNRNKYLNIVFDDDILKYLIGLSDEKGMRKLRENLKKIVERINLCYYSGGSYAKQLFDIIKTKPAVASTSKNKKRKIVIDDTEPQTIIVNKDILKIIEFTQKKEMSSEVSNMYL